jgi:SAM-dependent methyltransferase
MSEGLPSGYIRFFDELRTWGRTYASLSDGERSRVDAIVELMPTDAATVLEVGCGDGVVSNHLADRGIDVTGADISAPALLHVRGKTVLASSDSLPFDDAAFDCIIAADLLEHLPAGVFENTLAELARVSAKYLIINSPHREDLVLAQTRCGRCKSTFHASRHVRSVDETAIAMWFPEFSTRSLRATGETWEYRSRRLQRTAQLLGNVWYRDEAVCPTCGYSVDPPQPNPVIRGANGLCQRLLRRVRSGRPSELVVLIERR